MNCFKDKTYELLFTNLLINFLDQLIPQSKFANSIYVAFGYSTCCYVLGYLFIVCKVLL